MTRTTRWPRIAAALAGFLCLGAAVDARAGGMTLHTRGVRPSARGGAFVAGADDLGALWFNPAGIANTAGSRSFLFDVAYVGQKIDYTRIDENDDVFAPVSNSARGLPVPSIAYAQPVFGGKAQLAFGLYAPYAGLAKFPADGPQRYSSIDLSESLLVVLSAGIGYRVNDHLRVGATLQNMFFGLSSTVVMGSCVAGNCVGNEDPDWDALVKLTQVDYFSPSASIGVQYDAGKWLTLGAALQAPNWINGRGKAETKLPATGFFNGAHVEGDRADVSFTLPAIVRAGAEVHSGKRLRAELAIDAELWGMHDEMKIKPKGIAIVDSPGVNSYELHDLNVPRHYKNSIAASIGVEAQPMPKVPLSLLAGYTYETAAAPTEYLSVLTVDGAKQVFSGGLGVEVSGFRLNCMVSLAMMADRTVTLEEAKATQLTPLRPADTHPVNAGTYSSSWVAAGVGVSKAF